VNRAALLGTLVLAACAGVIDDLDAGTRDAATAADAAMVDDAGPVDSGADGGSPDAGSVDAGAADSGSPDAGAPDAGAVDAGSFDAGRGVTTQRPLGTTAAGYGYIEYLPGGYAQVASWPLLIVNHGVSELGNGTTQLDSVRVNGPNVQIDQRGQDFPMVILTPQYPPPWPTPNGDSTALDAFVTYALGAYKVDPRRVYMTGLSMGGGATWDYAAAHADRLAAIVPISAATSFPPSLTAASSMVAQQHLSIWAAHALDDPMVSQANTRAWFDVLGHALGTTQGVFDHYNFNWSGANTAHYDTAGQQWLWLGAQSAADDAGTPFSPAVVWTLYATGGHAVWDRMYSDPAMYAWLLRQARP
jgi:predicted peptidase